MNSSQERWDGSDFGTPRPVTKSTPSFLQQIHSIKMREHPQTPVHVPVSQTTPPSSDSDDLACLIDEWDSIPDDTREDFHKYAKKLLILMARHIAKVDSSIQTHSHLTQRSFNEIEQKWKDCAEKISNGVNIGMNIPLPSIILTIPTPLQKVNSRLTLKFRRRSTIRYDRHRIRCSTSSSWSILSCRLSTACRYSGILITQYNFNLQMYYHIQDVHRHICVSLPKVLCGCSPQSADSLQK